MFTDFECPPREELHREIEATALPSSLGALLDETAARHGSRLALSFFDEGVDLTWAALRAEVGQAANALRRLGVCKGTHVAVLLPNVPVFPILWLALGRLGAIMIPVNITYTAREIDYVLTDGSAALLIVHAELLPGYEAIESPPLPMDRVVVVGGTIICDAHDWSEAHDWRDLAAAAEPAFTEEEAVGPDDLVNIQYTSGTTGFPKGCMLSHRYWISLGYVTVRFWATPIRRIYGGANFYYMLLQRMLVNAAFGGGALFVPRRPGARNFMAEARALGCENAAIFEAIYKQPPHPDDGRNALKIVNIFGFTPENQADFQRRFDVVGQEFYGMTETAHITYMPASEALERTGSGSCGVVAPGREVSLRDADWRAVATGEQGELWVRGEGILQGYWNKPEANAESFRDGWFRTGDLARVDGAGYYTVLGRTKDMIRRNGENIAAREVEAVMRLLPQVREAAALAVPDPYSGEEVKLYLEMQPGFGSADLTPEAVFAHARANLAHFKVPRYIAYREALPRTVETDRVEKKKLRAETGDLRIGAYDRRDGIWR
jgi:crotonobetaine/carnitine-CoA ligase